MPSSSAAARHAGRRASALVDTLLLARRRHPAGPNGLDHLCVRYGIDNSRRTKHGALLDAELLAEVYVELIGGRQASLVLVEAGRATVTIGAQGRSPCRRGRSRCRRGCRMRSSQAHAAFIATLGDKAIWRDYDGEADCEACGLA